MIEANVPLLSTILADTLAVFLCNNKRFRFENALEHIQSQNKAFKGTGVRCCDPQDVHHAVVGELSVLLANELLILTDNFLGLDSDIVALSVNADADGFASVYHYMLINFNEVPLTIFNTCTFEVSDDYKAEFQYGLKQTVVTIN